MGIVYGGSHVFFIHSTISEAARELSDGSIIVGGPGNFNMWFVKLSPGGELIWERYYGSEEPWEFCGDLFGR